ncbi:ricin-type beta-trefoil lectin domain protein [Streptomyces aquilus]|uniref:ricin-type beta-trefoil lectin domain protein n=1 Tax=Streptomyces aquilus TaxID=2548456 RepID=UPI003683F52E
MDIWHCNGQSNQRWQVNADGSITRVQPSLGLDVTGGATANGTAVELRNCTGAAHRRRTTSGGSVLPPGCSLRLVSPGATQQATTLPATPTATTTVVTCRAPSNGGRTTLTPLRTTATTPRETASATR